MLKNVRIWFKKDGPAKYISHLDLARCMGYVLKMARLPVWYTEGFNPRIHMTFAMPLSLGVSGEQECMDIRLTEEVSYSNVTERMNRHLPVGLQVYRASDPVMTFNEIQFADYTVELEAEGSREIADDLAALLAQEEITVMKHAKKGAKEFEIKPFLNAVTMDITGSQTVKLTLCLPCSTEGSINPNLLLEALKKYKGITPYASVTRNGLLTKDHTEFL